MTNPALDALKIVDEFLHDAKETVAFMHDDDPNIAEAAAIVRKYQTIRTALSNAPQGVTVEDLKLEYEAHGSVFIECLPEWYPNGIKITAATAPKNCDEKPAYLVKEDGSIERVRCSGCDALVKAAQDFIDKCDRGEAESVRSYKALKEALAAHRAQGDSQ